MATNIHAFDLKAWRSGCNHDPQITALQASLGVSGALLVQCHRFSPYYFQKGRWTEDVRAAGWYSSLFPADQIDLEKVAYYFDATWKDTLGDAAYGVAIKERLDRETRRDISIGAVYAALDRLEAKRLVESRETPGPAARGGRRRRSFTTTVDGRKTLRELRVVRERLWRAAPARAR